ncbi:MAG: hypothetical protein B7Z35_01180 [Hydrogenophilales bacterium 12-61-10]|nr:MAG: hypothetical protein B7Z35_01180 [Hydrogenophilales bacterium 12-61-10]OYX31239.1 MAG: hypothetical protein B7Z03_04555 [Hydrogenophilales bacterium 32-62-9]
MGIKNPSLQDALEVLLQRQREHGKPVIDYPISLLQRRLRLGYACAVSLMGELKLLGFVRTISETAVQLTFSPTEQDSP